jgi:hypothetical protein
MLSSVLTNSKAYLEDDILHAIMAATFAEGRVGHRQQYWIFHNGCNGRKCEATEAKQQSLALPA